MASKFSRDLNELSKHLRRVQQGHGQVLKRSVKNKGRPHKAREHQWQQCYKPLGKCRLQQQVWGSVWCMTDSPTCLKEIKNAQKL